MRRLLAGAVVCAVACALGGGVVGSAPAAEPEGPQIAFAELRLREPIGKSYFGIATVGAGGEQPRTVISGTGKGLRPFGTLSWSPDGSQLAFVGLTSKLTEPRKKTAIYLLPAAGGTPRRLAGTGGGSSPVWSPDGRRIAFSRDRVRFRTKPTFSVFLSTSTWIVPAAGGDARRLTRWRNNQFIKPSSFSPDGGSLALTRESGKPGPEAVLLDLSGGGMSVVDREAEDPVFSPDGSRIALASFRDGVFAGKGQNRTEVSDLYTVDPDGGNPRRLTDTPHRQEKSPSWDPSGTRIGFMQTPAHLSLFALTSAIAEVNSDGTCPQLVVPSGGAVRSVPEWQPGPGRSAPPLSC